MTITTILSMILMFFQMLKLVPKGAAAVAQAEQGAWKLQDTLSILFPRPAQAAVGAGGRESALHAGGASKAELDKALKAAQSLLGE